MENKLKPGQKCLIIANLPGYRHLFMQEVFLVCRIAAGNDLITDLPVSGLAWKVEPKFYTKDTRSQVELLFEDKDLMPIDDPSIGQEIFDEQIKETKKALGDLRIARDFVKKIKV